MDMWVTVPEYAKLTGRSKASIYRSASRGTIESKPSEDGSILILWESTGESTEYTAEYTESIPESTDESTDSTGESTNESTEYTDESTIQSTESTSESTGEYTDESTEYTRKYVESLLDSIETLKDDTAFLRQELEQTRAEYTERIKWAEARAERSEQRYEELLELFKRQQALEAGRVEAALQQAQAETDDADVEAVPEDEDDTEVDDVVEPDDVAVVPEGIDQYDQDDRVVAHGDDSLVGEAQKTSFTQRLRFLFTGRL